MIESPGGLTCVDFNAETYAKHTFGIVGGEELTKVRLLFDAKLTVYIAERQWHPSQEFRKRSGGRVEMRLETTGRKELIRWVLSWMPDVKVLAPKSLRDRIAEKLQDGLHAQEWQSGRSAVRAMAQELGLSRRSGRPLGAGKAERLS